MKNVVSKCNFRKDGGGLLKKKKVKNDSNILNVHIFFCFQVKMFLVVLIFSRSLLPISKLLFRIDFLPQSFCSPRFSHSAFKTLEAVMNCMVSCRFFFYLFYFFINILRFRAFVCIFFSAFPSTLRKLPLFTTNNHYSVLKCLI